MAYARIGARVLGFGLGYTRRVTTRGSVAACVPMGLLLLTTFVACGSTANVSEVYTGLDAPDGKGETRRRNVFFTDSKEIHCIAEVGVGRSNVTLEGKFHQVRAYNFQSNEFFTTDRFLGYVDVKPEPTTDGPLYLDLELRPVGPDGKPKDGLPFEAGSYVCEVMLDGEIAGTANFNVDFPPCPAALIVNGTTCFGFFTGGTDCPKYGLRSDDPAKCQCSETKGWECDE